MKTKSYGMGGQDPRALFRAYDPDKSGELELAEFTQAIRKGGKVAKGSMSDDELSWIFNELDTYGGGAVGVDELMDFVWGTSYAHEHEEVAQQKQADDSWRMNAVNFLDQLAELDDGS